MDDAMKLAQAKLVYSTLCSALDNRNWHYTKDDEKLVVRFTVGGDDLPMDMIIEILPDRQLIRLLSPMSYKISEGKRMEAALAVCAAGYGLVDGNFDYDMETGRIFFRMTASFRESVIGEALFRYMIDCACWATDDYNDKFLALDKGYITVNDFLQRG